MEVREVGFEVYIGDALAGLGCMAGRSTIAAAAAGRNRRYKAFLENTPFLVIGCLKLSNTPSDSGVGTYRQIRVGFQRLLSLVMLCLRTRHDSRKFKGVLCYGQ